jgi:hypothetical protein
MDSLRKRLQAMTEIEDVSQHRGLLDAIAREYPHTILVLASAHPIARYTCLMHALGFVGSPQYEMIASRGFNVVFAGPGFAHWLLDRNALTEISDADVKEGDIVFYFDDGRFTHAGLALNHHRVVSKWGKGHLYEHALWEVPQSYGTTVRFFKQLRYDEAVDSFIQFAREKGMLL